MNVHPASSEVSEAEEVTEAFVDKVKGGVLESGSRIVEQSDETSRDERDPSEVEGGGGGGDPGAATIKYDTIRPDHIRIISIDVDLQVKPKHLSLADKDAFWLGSDSMVDERRKQSIVHYLTRSGDAIGTTAAVSAGQHGKGSRWHGQTRPQRAWRKRIMSLANDSAGQSSPTVLIASASRAAVDTDMDTGLVVTDEYEYRRCNSLNDVAAVVASWDGGPRRLRLGPIGRVMQDAESREDCTASFNSMADIMDNLDFQVNQRNERSHFIVTDLLIQTIEFLLSDDMLTRSCSSIPVPNTTSSRSSAEIALCRLSHSDLSCLLRSSTSSRRSGRCGWSSSAEVLASLVIEEVIPAPILSRLSGTLPDTDKTIGNPKCSPPSLQLLLKRIDRNRDSNSFDIRDTRSSHQIAASQQEHRASVVPVLDTDTNRRHSCDPISDSLVRALVETCVVPISLPVGEFPVLGSDLSLPAYVVTRGPRVASYSSTLQSQQHRCPGCRQRFSPETARKRLRLCRYYGLYFCSVCHQNTLMLVPARILAHWDFSMVPVSCVARDLLKLIHAEPLFSAHHFSESLRARLPVLWTVARLRLQAAYLMDFIDRCRQDQHLKLVSKAFPVHWLSKEKPQKFSIADFQQMEFRSMSERLRSFVSQCVEHISICPLCQAHGFLCELCRHSDIIFPFEIEKVYQCENCNACFHRSCFFRKPALACPKCERRKRRKLQHDEDSAESEVI